MGATEDAASAPFAARGEVRTRDTGARLNIEEPDVLRVLLDEVAPRLDLVAHQHREGQARGRSVFHLDADQHAARRVHRRVAELLGIHLAQALEAADLEALLRELDRLAAKLLEGLDVPALLSERELERGNADDVGELR